MILTEGDEDKEKKESQEYTVSKGISIKHRGEWKTSHRGQVLYRNIFDG